MASTNSSAVLHLSAHQRGDAVPSQADEALRRARLADARPLPREPRARRRAIAVRGW